MKLFGGTQPIETAFVPRAIQFQSTRLKIPSAIVRIFVSSLFVPSKYCFAYSIPPSNKAVLLDVIEEFIVVCKWMSNDSECRGREALLQRAGDSGDLIKVGLAIDDVGGHIAETWRDQQASIL